MKALKHLKIAVLAVVGLVSVETRAQLAPMGSIYFNNQYLNNPAYAGRETGFRGDFGYRQQWSSLPGSPKTQVITATYGLSEKSGVGMNFYNDEAGLIKRTRLMGTYAYHLPLNTEGHKLSFGVSFGYMDENLDYSRMDGDAGDQSVVNFNQRSVYVDGDFGVAYTGSRLSLQASVPNLKSFFNRDNRAGNIVDEARFYTAASYKIDLSENEEGNVLEPMVAIRSVRGYDNMIDAGANLIMAGNKMNIMAMYHSSQNATLGLGVKCLDAFWISGLYSSGSTTFRGETSGNFELNLKVLLKKRKDNGFW